jgi:hypothetical protein
MSASTRIFMDAVFYLVARGYAAPARIVLDRAPFDRV